MFAAGLLTLKGGIVEDEIKVRDTVRVISGGPTMTVASIGEYLGETCAICHWFDGKRPENGRFPLTVLKKIDPSAGVGGIYVGGGVRRG